MKLRKALKEFAEIQEEILRAHEGKAGWDDCSNTYLFDNLNMAAKELERALMDGDHYDITKECANIANYAMMLADNNKGV